jgi:hypothetical protein
VREVLSGPEEQGTLDQVSGTPTQRNGLPTGYPVAFLGNSTGKSDLVLRQRARGPAERKWHDDLSWNTTIR